MTFNPLINPVNEGLRVGDVRVRTSGPEGRLNRNVSVQPVAPSQPIDFEGIIGSAVSLGDAVVRDMVEGDVESEINTLNNEFGVDEVVKGLGGQSGQPPEEVTRALEEVSRIKKAYENGSLNEMVFYARAENIVRQLKSRNAGYSDYVDELITKGLFGRTPANMIRQELFNLQKAGETSDQGLSETTLFNARRELAQRGFSNTANLTVNEILRLNEEYGRREGEFRNGQREMELLSQQDNLDKEELYRTGKRTAIAYYDLIAMSTVDKLSEMSRNAISDKTITPEEHAQLVQEAFTARDSVLTGFRKTFSFLEIELSSEQYADIEGSLTRRMDEVMQYIDEEKYDIATMAATLDQTERDRVARRMRRESPELMTLESLKDLVGEQAFSMMMLGDIGNTTSAAALMAQGWKKALRNYGMDVGKNLAEITSAVETEEPEEHHRLVGEIIQGAQRTILDPSQEDKAKIFQARRLFTADYTTSFSREAREQNFSLFSTPEFINSMKELPVAEQRMFTNFMMKNFAIIAKPTFDNLDLEDVEVTFGNDGKAVENSLITYENGQFVWNGQGSRSAQVEKANQYITQIAPILEMNGSTVERFITTMTGGNVDLGPGVTPTRTESSATIEDYYFESSSGEVTQSPLDTKFFQEGIVNVESQGNYNAYYGDSNQSSVDFTSMTIDQIKDYQDANRIYLDNGDYTTAIGKYQIVNRTLDTLVDELELTGNELFDENMQDRLALALLERRGLYKYLRGQISEPKFITALGNEWAGFKKLKPAEQRTLVRSIRDGARSANDVEFLLSDED